MAAETPLVENFVSMLHKCRVEKRIPHATHLYSYACNHGLEIHRAVGNYIVPMLADCGNLLAAQHAFNRLVHRNQYSWTSLLLGYIECGHPDHALNLYQNMQQDSVVPSRHTLMALLKACARLKDTETGRGIHTEIVEKAFDMDLFVGSTLVDMYAKCGSLLEAQEVFDSLQDRNVVSWNALIAGYAEHGPGQEALKWFERMQLEGIAPSPVTFLSVLKACGNIGALEKGRELHMKIAQKGFETEHLFVGNTLVDMYAKCGSLSEAQEVFGKLPVQTVVSWNALIAGYADHGPALEALKCFEQMQLKGTSPDSFTYVCVLKACGNIGAIEKARKIHKQISESSLGRQNAFIANTLIDMYAKCGSVSEAWEVFEKLVAPNVVSWNAMINGYSMNHEVNMALECFKDMEVHGVEPDDITFTCLLTACSRASLVFEGQSYFKLMREDYGVIPTVDHYTCMVDILARAGHLQDTQKFLDAMPFLPSIEMWTALLCACKSYGEADLGLRCFKQLVEMNREDSASYVLMTSIYANAGMTGDAYKLEELRKHSGARKNNATALIEVNNKVHEFVVGNNQSIEISAMLEFLNLRMNGKGYVPTLNMVLKPMSDDDKEMALCEHAEKLALAFGLLNTPHGQTLRVTKNMRMCNNCHNANKVLSQIEKREIIVRDRYCVHLFKDASCSCGDLF